MALFKTPEYLRAGASAVCRSIAVRSDTFASEPVSQGDKKKRMGWDSNPGYPYEYSSFQDCRLRPLGHPSD